MANQHMSARRGLRMPSRATAGRLALAVFIAGPLAAGVGPPAAAASSTSGSVAPGQAVQVSGDIQLDGIACPTDVTCWAVGYNLGSEGIVVQIDDGMPGPVTSVPGTYALSAISCFPWNTGEVCEAVGYGPSGGVVVPMDVTPGNPSAPEFLGGAQPAEQVAGSTDLLSISCPSSATCEASGSTNGPPSSTSTGVVVRFASTGGDLPLPQPPTAEVGTNWLSGVSCPSENSCVVVGVAGPDDVVISVTKGIVGTSQPVAPGGAFAGVACSSPNSCVAVDPNTGVVPIRNGTPQPVADTSTRLLGVACVPGSTLCVGVGEGSVSAGSVVGGAAVVPIESGVPGAAVPVPNDTEPAVNGAAPGPTLLDGVDCPSTFQCVAVGNATTQTDRYSTPVFTAWVDPIQVI